MKRKWGKLVALLLIVTSTIFICANSYAHSGRTDSSGGHKDNKNKSGLGYYHYHCGGHPAHLHKNGVCPYSKSSSTSSKSSTSNSKSKKSSSNTKSKTTSSSSAKTTSTVPTTIAVTNIKINESVVSMNIGESENLSTTIMPNNATDKKVTWKSSDESIVTISTTGEIIAKKSGTVTITASTSNGKTVSRKIKVNETKNESLSDSLIEVNANSTNTINSSADDSDVGGAIVALGLLGGGSYFGYKKYKKSKNSKG